jgi:hypothetical protein
LVSKRNSRPYEPQAARRPKTPPSIAELAAGGFDPHRLPILDLIDAGGQLVNTYTGWDKLVPALDRLKADFYEIHRADGSVAATVRVHANGLWNLMRGVKP